jgi:coenzyme F420-reducing hydrogenase delta subunit
MMTNDTFEPLIIAFSAASNCFLFGGRTLPGSMRLQYPTNVRIVLTPLLREARGRVLSEGL